MAGGAEGSQGARGARRPGAPWVPLLLLARLRAGGPLEALASGNAEEASPPGLAEGLEALCGGEFATLLWGRRAALLRPAGRPFAGFFELADLAELLRAPNLSVQVVGGAAAAGRTSAVSAQPRRRAGHVLDFFSGATLALSAIERQVPALAAWARAFARSFGVPCEVNLYLTPPGAQAFSLHNDRQDVLAFQISGGKEWKVWDLAGAAWPNGTGIDPVEAPFRHTVALQLTDAPSWEVLPVPSLEVTLQPGSLLYVPRGSLHVASTANPAALVGAASLHLTVGVLSQSFSYAFAAFTAAAEPEVAAAISAAGWRAERFRRALMEAAERRDGVELRRSLPLGWVQEAMGQTNTSAHHGSCLRGGGTVDAARAEVRQRLQAAIGGVLSAGPLELSDGTLQATAAVFVRHLDKFDQELASPTALAGPGAAEPAEAPELELPAGVALTLAAAAGEGEEVDACFSQGPQRPSCAARRRYPPGLRPLLEAVAAGLAVGMAAGPAAATARALRLAELGGGDPVPALLLALSLEQLPLEPGFWLRAPGAAAAPAAAEPGAREPEPPARAEL